MPLVVLQATTADRPVSQAGRGRVRQARPVDESGNILQSQETVIRSLKALLGSYSFKNF